MPQITKADPANQKGKQLTREERKTARLADPAFKRPATKKQRDDDRAARVNQ